MTEEARIEATDTGLRPADDGWWILNLARMGWYSCDGVGIFSSFEAPSSRSTRLGIGVHIHDPAAARHGASPPCERTSADEVYADRPPILPARSPWPLP